MKIVASNKKAFFDYEILDKIEAGIVLTGDEVKSVRAGHVNLTAAYATLHQGELKLINCSITPYQKAYQKLPEDAATKSRTLLLHRREINRLAGDISRKGITIVPLKMYLNEKGLVKVELGIAKHKKTIDKKEAIKERDIKRETARTLKNLKS